MAKFMISVYHLVKKFNGFFAVDDISFEVKKNEIFALLGPNGAGKTTTIKILATLFKPTSGVVKINGFDVIKQENEARNSFGIIFQDQSIDEELTAQENMEFHGVVYHMPKALIKERTRYLLNLVDLWDRRNDLVKKFSGGMKRRLEIARVLMHHPKLLFLDEPTLGLDPQTRLHVWDYIKNLDKLNKATVLFTTHYMEEAEKMAERIAIMDKGKIIGEGTADELKIKTNTASLEEAFLYLTGRSIKDAEGNHLDAMRMHKRMRR